MIRKRRAARSDAYGFTRIRLRGGYMTEMLRIRRRADDRIRRIESAEFVPPFRDVLRGIDADTREEITFRAAHVLKPLPSHASGAVYDSARGIWRTDTGAACRCPRIRWEPPSNAAAEREFLRIEEENARLRAELIRLSRA